MSFSPVIQARPLGHRPRRRLDFSFVPPLLASAGLVVVFLAVILAASLHGIHALDPAAQIFVGP